MDIYFRIISLYRFLDLRRRFEAPNASNRWDCPLFCVDMTPTLVPPSPPAEPSAASSCVDSFSVGTGDKASLPPAPADKQAISESEAGNISTVPTQAKLKSSSFRRAVKTAAGSETKIETQAALTAPASPIPENISQPSQESTGNVDNRLTFSGYVIDSTKRTSVVDGVLSCVDQSKQTPDQCCAEVLDFLQNAVAPMPNPATVATPHANADLLYLLDKTSQDILNAIINHQNQDNSVGNPVIFREYDRLLEIHRHVSFAELQRHKRQFVKVNSQIPPKNEVSIGVAFIDFLAIQL